MHKAPGYCVPGPCAVRFSRGLGDGLVAAVHQAQRVGLEERNAGANKLSDEVVTVASNPNVTCLIDSQSAVGVEVGCGSLESGSG